MSWKKHFLRPAPGTGGHIREQRHLRFLRCRRRQPSPAPISIQAYIRPDDLGPRRRVAGQGAAEQLIPDGCRLCVPIEVKEQSRLKRDSWLVVSARVHAAVAEAVARDCGRGTIQGTGRESRNGFRRPCRKRTLIFFSIWFGGLLFLVGRCGRRSWWASHKATPPLTGARRHTSKDTCGLGCFPHLIAVASDKWYSYRSSTKNAIPNNPNGDYYCVGRHHYRLLGMPHNFGPQISRDFFLMSVQDF